MILQILLAILSLLHNWIQSFALLPQQDQYPFSNRFYAAQITAKLIGLITGWRGKSYLPCMYNPEKRLAVALKYLFQGINNRLCQSGVGGRERHTYAAGSGPGQSGSCQHKYSPVPVSRLRCLCQWVASLALVCLSLDFTCAVAASPV